ncbi:MAG: GNAT family N-acetyltransferase [Gemmatimonadaceae bacterium]|nr:GNAT family N-acetyltransferase [Gemmatimonadaceae bacterium]
MQAALAECAMRWPGASIRLGAQRYLEAFYGSLGFVPAGEPYVEDGIPHIEMVRAGG